MTRDEFDEIVEEVFISLSVEAFGKDAVAPWAHKQRDRFLRVSVEIGGAEGGSCWGDEPMSFARSVSPEELEIPFMEAFLNRLNPDYQTSKKLLSCVRQREENETGYYGNWSTIIVREIDLNDLWAVLEAGQ